MHTDASHKLQFQRIDNLNQMQSDEAVTKGRKVIGGYKKNKVTHIYLMIIIDYKIQIEMASKKAMIFCNQPPSNSDCKNIIQILIDCNTSSNRLQNIRMQSEGNCDNGQLQKRIM